MEWITVIAWLVGAVVVVLGPIILVHELGHFVTAKLAGVRVDEFGLGYPPRLLKLWRGKGHLIVGGTRVVIPRRCRLPPRVDVGSWVDAVVGQREDRAPVLREVSLLDPSPDELVSRHDPVGETVRIRGELTEFEPGTLYSLNLLPMGAFVRMMGEEDPTHPNSLAVQPKRWRVAVMASGAVLNLLCALLLMVSAYTFSGIPERWLVQVDSVEPGTAAAEAGLQAGDVIIAVDGGRMQEGGEEFREIILASPERELTLTILRDETQQSLVATPRRGSDGNGYLGVYMEGRPDPGSMHRFTLPEALRASTDDIVNTVTFPFRARRMLAEGEVTPEQIRPSSMVGISGLLAFFLQQALNWRWPFLILHTAGLVSLSLGLANLLPLPALDGGRILFVLIEAVRGRRVSPEREAMIHVIGLLVLVGLMGLVMVTDVINPVIPWSWLTR